MNIFSTPEAIINEIQAIKEVNEATLFTSLANFNNDSLSEVGHILDQIEVFLKDLYKRDNCLYLDRNYRYYQYFLFGPLDKSGLQRYFLDSNIYEFCDRVYFAEAFLKTNFSLFLYNMILLYKAFDIELVASKKRTETAIKLMKEPKLYESTLHEFANRFLMIPFTSFMNICFEPPSCQKLHKMKGPTYF